MSSWWKEYASIVHKRVGKGGELEGGLGAEGQPETSGCEKSIRDREESKQREEKKTENVEGDALSGQRKKMGGN